MHAFEKPYIVCTWFLKFTIYLKKKYIFMIHRVAEEVNTDYECLIIKMIPERISSLQDTRADIIQQLTK